MKQSGTPRERAKKDRENPLGMLKRYALEVAEAANVNIHFEVCDILEINIEKYGNSFDVVFMEGGVLHYFHDIDEFMHIMYSLLKSGGKMICSDFHPFTKISDVLDLEQQAVSYFSTDIFEGRWHMHAFLKKRFADKCLSAVTENIQLVRLSIQS